MKCKPWGRLPLNSGIRVETFTGDTNNFVPGEVMLVEDTNSKGYLTKNLEAKIRRSMFISF